MIQKSFGEFLENLRRAPEPQPGGDTSHPTPQENRPHD